jgi:glyoxylase-like metal-dependent hydrolase (beta-lactamase superfamily II)
MREDRTSKRRKAKGPSPQRPLIAPPGARVERYFDVPESAKGHPIDPEKGYRIQGLGQGLHMVTDNVYQSMFMVYEAGVVVVDAPPFYSAKIPRAIAEVSDKSITHVVYTRSHRDHIGGARELGGSPIIIAQEETKTLLVRANDPDRPIPTVTFCDQYTLAVGSEVLELSYRGNAHEPGNIFIFAPAQKALMVVDIIFPGWMPWRRFALAQDIDGYFAQVEEIKRFDFDTLVAGHVARVGTRADVEVQSEFMSDLKATVAAALRSTKPREGLDPRDLDNPYAVSGNHMDRVALMAVNALSPRWSKRLAGFDVFIWDQCYAMQQSLSLD